MTINKRFLSMAALVFTVGVVGLRAQVGPYAPSKERVDPTLRRRTEIDGNNIRASVFNFVFSGRTGAGQGVPFEWPKNTGRDYVALCSLFFGGEVLDDTGGTIHVVDVPAFRQSPSGSDWNMNPIPGYFNPKVGKIAKSDEPDTWPTVWPDKMADSVDPGWPGSWNGFFGKDQFNADQEMYYRDGDDNYSRFHYTPDTTDRSRKGLGLIVDVRTLEWSQASVADAFFSIQEVKNDGTKRINRMGFSIWLADLVGGDGDSQDDQPDFNLITDIAYSMDRDGVSSNPFFQGACVGAAGTLYLETPGNAEDRIDNDGDSPENPETGGGPAVTSDMLLGETRGDGIDNNHNGLIDEDSTYIAFGHQVAVTFANGLDDNFNGELNSPVVTQQMINEAATDVWADPVSGNTYHWHRWPPNPEQDTFWYPHGWNPGIPFNPASVQLIGLLQGDLGKKFKDNIDNDDNGPSMSYNNLPRVTQAMIDMAAQDPYHRYRVPGTNVVLYALTSADLGKRYLNQDGLRDAGVDEGIDEMIDESRNDGIDNNGDWNPLTDDVGINGDGSGGLAAGVHDGKPTSGAGTPFPGEPHIDKTDVKEADQIGLTNVQYLPAGAINFSTTADAFFWGNFMIPGSFVNPALIGTGDFDLFVSSGEFPLNPGQIERISYAVVLGNASTCPYSNDPTHGGAKPDVDRKATFAHLAYNENYTFAQAPYEPTVTAVAGDHRVTLYWDDKAEQSFDRFLAGINVGIAHDFEGYRIYRSTDPAFLDAQRITDANGNPAPWLKPIAQFDLKDGVTGWDSVGFNGTKFWMGDDTGLQHSWTDSTVQNGQKYYYVVRAYDKGAYRVYDTRYNRMDTLNISPSESNLKISIDNLTGQVKEVGTSVAVVVPEAPVAGYLPPNVTPITLVTGSTTGTVGYSIVDPNKILENHRYRITFEDTVLLGSGTAPDTFKTKTFTLADVSDTTAIDTLIRRSRSLADTIEQPLTDGFRLYLHNERNFGLNALRSGWNNYGIFSFDFKQWKSGFTSGLQQPSDYRIAFGDTAGIDTSTRFTVKSGPAPAVTLPAKPVNFNLHNTSVGTRIPFAFLEKDLAGGPGVFSAGMSGLNNNSDFIIFLDRGTRGDTIITWSFSLLYDTLGRRPRRGDTATIVLSKLFRKSDIFEFTTHAQKVDKALAANTLDNIKVVPNPYIAAATWEERNPFPSGRGPRSIHFNHLPQKCTIRIFNVSGELVTTIEHESSMLDGTSEWNLLTRDNLPAAYGVYIYHVDAPGIGEKVGKFAVIK